MTGSAGIVEFYEALFSEGTVRLAGSTPATGEEIAMAVKAVLHLERDLREHLPASPPTTNSEALTWAVSMFHRASQLLVYRELGAEVVQQDLSLPAPEGRTPPMIYSVDLVFRFLPDLWRIARAAAPDDPLVKKIVDWGNTWPLSGVGIPSDGPVEIEPILSDRCLSRMFIDRIIEKRDERLLSDERVRSMVAAALGEYSQLAPELANVVNG